MADVAYEYVESTRMLSDVPNSLKRYFDYEAFGRVFSELVKEESWNIIKKYKNPKIDFRTLNALVIQKIKQTKVELFA
jgi:antirestriction protein